jgi:hypothetical protein
MRKGSKRLLGAGIFAGLAYSAWQAWRRRVPQPTGNNITWDNAPFPFPPIPRPAMTAVAMPIIEPSIDPDADGSCPATHPVKAKLASGIYHVPGGGNYDRTRPDRCYLDAAAAEADGLRAAKRQGPVAEKP